MSNRVSGFSGVYGVKYHTPKLSAHKPPAEGEDHDALVHDLIIGLRSGLNSPGGVFVMEWHRLSSGREFPILVIPDDAWGNLAQILAALREGFGRLGHLPTVDAVCAALEEAGFTRDPQLEQWIAPQPARL